MVTGKVGSKISCTRQWCGMTFSGFSPGSLISNDLPKLRSPIMSKTSISIISEKSMGADQPVVLLLFSIIISFQRSTCLMMKLEAARRLLGKAGVEQFAFKGMLCGVDGV